MFTNTQVFKEEALYFLKHSHYNCGLKGTDEYEEYWDEQERRIDDGYIVGDVAITGEHYGYLNFAQIMLTDDPDFKQSGELVTKMKGSKKKTFPDFFDGDFTYYWAKQIAKDGIDKDFYEKYVKPHMLCRIPEEYLYDGGHHLCVGKKRRAGYSYKNGWIAANRYNRQKNKVTLICAYDKKYLYPKGTMQMASDYVDFINKNTVWAKRKLINKQDHIKSGFRTIGSDGVEYDEGFLSEIIAITFGSNAGAARGKDGDLILVEETGVAPNLLEFESATKPTVEDGIYVTGQMIYFGTGGGDSNYWEGFEEIFYNPEKYNMLPIYNDWDEGASGLFCSFFVPETWNMKGAIDLNGNSLFDKSLEIVTKRREDLKKLSKDSTTLTRHMMERPMNPAEAFSISGSNHFPIADLQQHLNYVKVNELYRTMATVGTLINRDGNIDFIVDESLIPIWEFPHKNTENLSGAIVIYQKPLKKNGVVPSNLYRICNDPYAHDQSSNSESLGSTYVIMNSNNMFPPGDRIVAAFHGRPATLDDYNRLLFMLAEYYNCQIGFENDRGDVIGYAKRFKKLHLLAPEFELAFDANIPKSSVRRFFGMHIGSGKDNVRIGNGDLYLRDWLIRERGKSEDGKYLLNLHLIYDIGLLQELIKYKSGGNFDRVSSLRIGMYYEKEMLYNNIGVKATQQKKDSLFTRNLYQNA